MSIEQLMDSKLKCVFEMPSSSGEKTVSIIFIRNLDILILIPQLFFALKLLFAFLRLLHKYKCTSD